MFLRNKVIIDTSMYNKHFALLTNNSKQDFPGLYWVGVDDALIGSRVSQMNVSDVKVLLLFCFNTFENLPFQIKTFKHNRKLMLSSQ